MDETTKGVTRVSQCTPCFYCGFALINHRNGRLGHEWRLGDRLTEVALIIYLHNDISVVASG